MQIIKRLNIVNFLNQNILIEERFIVGFFLHESPFLFLFHILQKKRDRDKC